VALLAVIATRLAFVIQQNLHQSALRWYFNADAVIVTDCVPSLHRRRPRP
jgi:hypothetical protein